jgi:hypothetical protein
MQFHAASLATATLPTSSAAFDSPANPSAHIKQGKHRSKGSETNASSSAYSVKSQSSCSESSSNLDDEKIWLFDRVTIVGYRSENDNAISGI